MVLRPLFHALLDLIYPSTCIVCGVSVSSEKPPVCSNCLDRLEVIKEPICHRCGYPQDILFSSLGACRHCPAEKIHFHTARSILSYADTNVRVLIHGLKYHFLTRLADPLSEILLEGFKRDFGNAHFDAIAPVPLHKKRQREREFNQSTLLGKRISQFANLPIYEDLVTRIRKTVPQTSLDPMQRQTNVVGAFAAARPERIADLSFLVIDDVYTTGSTVNEVCATLKNNGAARVDVLTLARAV
ncbi:MAG: ComF family protein [Candidatus Omnitrophota bacterium]|jgi:ComF family protein|nr:MAG: ComF family protein [Candidatus Omnitrophota bacterium]